MKVTIDENAKNAIKELIGKSSDEYIRIKALLACGSSFYEIYTDFKREDDTIYEVEGITFVLDEISKKACKNISIEYDINKYTNGFYIRDNS